MKRAATVLLFAALPAFAEPVAITCNGTGLDPVTGRQALAGVMSFGFEFDQRAGTMALTRGAPARTELHNVRVTEAMASGSDGKWVYEVNRIDGTATIRTDLSTNPHAGRLGLGGNYFKGDCAVAGTARF